MIQNPCNMSDAEVREWAYDWGIELIDQDEDLLLYDARYMPALAACVRDESCPKSEYIVSIMGLFANLRLLHRKAEEAHVLADVVRASLAMSGGERLEALAYLLPALERLVRPSPMSSTEADALAHDLLIRHTVRTLAREPELAGYRVYTYHVPYNPFFYVSLSTGAWKYSPMQRLTANDLASV